MNTVFLGLGSNIGDREKNLTQAIEEIKQLSETRVQKTSNFLNTKAVTLTSEDQQADYLNGVLEITTSLTPAVLLQYLKNIEAEMGRDMNARRWGPRLIDIDILFYNDLIFSNEMLTIPHPHAHTRPFVLEPLAQIAPNFIHPVCKKTILELLNSL